MLRDSHLARAPDTLPRRAACGTSTRALPTAAVRLRTVELFRALGHELRLHVLLVLSRSGGLSVSELQQVVGSEQSALSHQLKILKEARLVRSSRRGRRVIYQLDDAHVGRVVEDAIAHVVEDSDQEPPPT